jgi:tetratricopeptide (TPR) repeat protein
MGALHTVIMPGTMVNLAGLISRNAAADGRHGSDSVAELLRIQANNNRIFATEGARLQGLMRSGAAGFNRSLELSEKAWDLFVDGDYFEAGYRYFEAGEIEEMVNCIEALESSNNMTAAAHLWYIGGNLKMAGRCAAISERRQDHLDAAEIWAVIGEFGNVMRCAEALKEVGRHKDAGFAFMHALADIEHRPAAIRGIVSCARILEKVGEYDVASLMYGHIGMARRAARCDKKGMMAGSRGIIWRIKDRVRSLILRLSKPDENRFKRA